MRAIQLGSAPLNGRLPQSHIEVARGSGTDNRNYLLKIGKWEQTEKKETLIDYIEVGELKSPQEKKQSLMSIVLEDIKNGKSVTDIIEENPSLAFKIKQLSELRQKYLAKQYLGKTRNVNVIYKYGATGTGKSKSTLEEFPDAYRITNYRLGRGGVYFDGYDGNSAIVFEEFSSNKIPIVEMLNYLDIYYIMLPCRYFDVVRNISELW